MERLRGARRRSHQADALTTLSGVERRALGNGLRVLVRRDTSAPVAAIVTYVSAGYFDETDDVVGIAHVLEHMYFKGTPTRGVGDIARQTKAVGGYLNAATIYDHTLYYAVVPSSGFGKALEIQADAFRNSLIDKQELANELEVIIQEAKRKADNPPAVASETLYEMLHDQHRMRRWRIGREPGLRKLTNEDVRGFYRNFYRPSQTVLVVVGDVSVDDAYKQVERLYGDLPSGEPKRSPGPSENSAPGFRYRELSGDIAQTQVALGWRTVPTLHKDTPALEMLSAILSAGRASRLYRATRERQLVSSISAYNYTPRDLGVFAVQCEAPPDQAGAALDAVWDQLRDVRKNGIRDDELERARRITESRWLRRFEDMEGQANHIAEWESLGRWEMGDEFMEKFMRVTADQVRDVAKRYVNEEQASVLVYRPNSAAPLGADAPAIRKRLSSAKPAPLAASNPSPALELRGHEMTLVSKGAVSGVQEFSYGSGVSILVKRRPGAVTYAGVFAVGGACEEDEAIAGRTLLMARTALKGTTTRDAVQIAEAGEMLGGSVSSSVGGESFGWSISVPKQRIAEALVLLADVAQRPTFAQEALETERAIALADVAALRDDMYRYPMRLAVQTAFAGHPYGVPAMGTDASLRTHTSGDLAEWHRSKFMTGATVIAIAGDSEPIRLAGMAAKAFSEMRGRLAQPIRRPEWPAGVAQAVEARDKAQSALVLSWPSPARGDVARFDVAMLASIASGLGGRFFEELRDKQSLCYTVHAFGNERRAAGSFSAYIATSPEKEDAARAGLLAEIQKLRDALVTDEELKRAQEYAVGVHAIRQQSGAAVLGDIVDAWMFGRLDELDDFERCVRAVTAQRIRDVAQQYFDPQRRVEGIVRGAGKSV
jgi:zinc protease